MIIDKIDRLTDYQALLPKLPQALAAVKEHQDSFEEGVRYPFDGGVVFFQKGETKPLSEAQFEAHRKFIDVQLVLEGAEYMALTDHSEVEVAIPYDEGKDVEKYSGQTQHIMKVSAGMGYVCFPRDVHKAVFHLDESLAFTKAVIKLEI